MRRMLVNHVISAVPVVACRWGEALAVLQAEPTALLRMCQLRREFALGGQAARRFALPEAEVRLGLWVRVLGSRCLICWVTARSVAALC